MPLDASTPPVNIYQGGGQLSIAIPIPGAHPDNVQVRIGPRLLFMRAECKYPQEAQHYHRRDWQVGSWQVELALPDSVDPLSARATLNFGVLLIMAQLAKSDADERELTVGATR
jgi:HSP20 family molecular chaperone IbpA